MPDDTMPNITVDIPHQLSRDEARQRIQDLVARSRRDLSGLGAIEERWTGDSLAFTISAAGSTINGKLFIEDQVVRIEVALPWMLGMLASQIREKISQE